MRAIWITKAGGPDALELRETADPEPGPGQVRVRVRAAGLCFADVMAAQGLYPDAPKPPCVVGYEAAGVVDAGSSEDHPVGQRVLAVTHFGGHSDVVCVPAEQVSEIPDGASFEEAAAIPINYLTAYHLLFRVANVRPHERVLVHMAAGGVGTAALQLCRTIDELVTFGTASAAKHEVLRAEGCRYPIDYRTVDYAAEIRRLTGGEGVDVVFARGERRNPARVAAQALATPLLTPLQLMAHNRTVSGVHLGRLWGEAASLREEFQAVLALWEAGRIKPRIDAAYPFTEAAAAHRRILRRQNVGKVVLTP
jgi:NADPH:quinone reductase-like Zn-dependent oxidoreductase